MFSFSSKSFLLLAITGCVLSMHSISEAQENYGDMDSEQTVNDPNSLNIPMAPAIEVEAAPTKPIIPDHPPVIERSHAALMPLSEVALPTPIQPVKPKTPLAWRAKTHKLGGERFSEDSTIQVGPLCRAVDGYYLDTMQAIISACNTAGYRVTNVNKAAGELLACNNADPNCRIVFAVWEKPAGKTWVKAGVERGAGSALTNQLSTILDTVCGTILPKGKI